MGGRSWWPDTGVSCASLEVSRPVTRGPREKKNHLETPCLVLCAGESSRHFSALRTPRRQGLPRKDGRMDATLLGGISIGCVEQRRGEVDEVQLISVGTWEWKKTAAAAFSVVCRSHCENYRPNPKTYTTAIFFSSRHGWQPELCRQVLVGLSRSPSPRTLSHVAKVPLLSRGRGLASQQTPRSVLVGCPAVHR